MIVHPEPQGSLEWLTKRAGVITASEFGNILTPEFKRRTGEMVWTYLCRTLAEKWLGSPLAGFQSIDMEIGQILESECIPFYELSQNTPITRVGLITNDAGTIGCSPDGLIGEESGIEIKAPRPETHVKYLLNAEVPKDYLTQVHGGMFVTQRPRWVFMSYCRRLPPLILVVERNPEIQERIHEALQAFQIVFEESWQRMIDINGGPPYRPTPFKRATPQERAPLHELELVP